MVQFLLPEKGYLKTSLVTFYTILTDRYIQALMRELSNKHIRPELLIEGTVHRNTRYINN